MEANSTYISLETAKLLKNSDIKSKYVYSYIDPNIPIIISRYNFMEEMPQIKFYPPYRENITAKYYPAYTWQEILWEYPQEFFGEDAYDSYGEYCHQCGLTELKRTYDIFDFLQDKKYDKADKYFRDNCILIK